MVLEGAGAVGVMPVVLRLGDVPVGPVAEVVCAKAVPVPTLKIRAVMRAARMECSNLVFAERRRSASALPPLLN
jgi:hypothetical protein